jgi:hypothetical protein
MREQGMLVPPEPPQPRASAGQAESRAIVMGPPALSSISSTPS